MKTSNKFWIIILCLLVLLFTILTNGILLIFSFIFYLIISLITYDYDESWDNEKYQFNWNFITIFSKYLNKFNNYLNSLNL